MEYVTYVVKKVCAAFNLERGVVMMSCPSVKEIIPIRILIVHAAVAEQIEFRISAYRSNLGLLFSRIPSSNYHVWYPGPGSSLG